MARATARRRFSLYLIKPSHYDDDGYVIQWWRSAIPSNTLAVLHGLAADCRDRGVLGDDVDLDIVALDETNTRIRPERIARAHPRRRRPRAGRVRGRAVQSVSARRSTSRGGSCAAGMQVVHRRLPRLRLHRHAARNCRPISARRRRSAFRLFAGEAEGRLDQVLRDAFAGTLKPLYNFMDDLPAWRARRCPILPVARVKRTAGGAVQLRRRPRLPVPMLVLHHHQRAGPQVALSLARRHRGDRARQLRAGRASASSSPTTTSPATGTGKRSSTG